MESRNDTADEGPGTKDDQGLSTDQEPRTEGLRTSELLSFNGPAAVELPNGLDLLAASLV
jgi:hypothetical protein